MNKPVDFIEFSLNGKTVAAVPGETLLNVAMRSGVASATEAFTAS